MTGNKLPYSECKPTVLIHCAYHKMGTIWMTKLLRQIASKYNLSLQVANENGDIHNGADILIANHSQLDLRQLGNYVGSHLIRDPRDAIVSGYHYHRWTDEAWAHQPNEKYGGNSYQQYLNGVSVEEGLAEEIKRFATYIRHYRLRDWEYNNPRIFEVKYESLIADEPNTFRKMFEHYGFEPKAIKASLKIAKSLSFDKVAKRQTGQMQTGKHLRSGLPNQWVEALNKKHCDLIKNLWGDLLVKMGYEANNDW